MEEGDRNGEQQKNKYKYKKLRANEFDAFAESTSVFRDLFAAFSCKFCCIFILIILIIGTSAYCLENGYGFEFTSGNNDDDY